MRFFPPDLLWEGSAACFFIFFFSREKIRPEPPYVDDSEKAPVPKVSDEVLEGQDWNRVFQRLTLYTYRRLGSRATIDLAQDVAAEAIRQFLDPDYAEWDQEKEPSLQRRLGSIVNGLLRNWRRDKATNVEVLHDFVDAVPQKVPSGLSSPEARSAAASDGRRALDLLLEQLDGDEHGQSILLLECDGVDEPKEQAAQLNVALPIVYKARYRLSRAREAVKQRLQGEVRHA